MLKSIQRIKNLQNKKPGYFIIAANIVPLSGLLFFGWEVIDVLLIFFTETAIICFYNILKIITVRMESYKEILFFQFVIKFFAAVIFLVHFGAMTVLMGAMVYLLASVFTMQRVDISALSIRAWPYFAALFLSYGYSFFTDYLPGEERKNASIRTLMIQPYFRLIALFTVIFIGGMSGILVVLKLGGGKVVLVFLVMLKTVIDIVNHTAERYKLSAAKKIDSGLTSLTHSPGRWMNSIVDLIVNRKRK